jgi:hypothetical protein
MMPVDHHQLARLVAAARLVTGGVLLVAPGIPARVWLGEEGRRRAVKVMARAVGARDIALALGTLRALAEGDSAPAWVAGSAASDASDALATLVGGARHQPARSLLVGAIAGTAAMAGAHAARHLRD